MTPKAKKEKSRLQETKLVDDLQELGFAAERIRDQPGRRLKEGEFGGDVSLPLMGVDYSIECKHHARFGSADIYKWLKTAPIICCQANRQKRVFAMDEDFFFKLIRHWESYRAPPISEAAE